MLGCRSSSTNVISWSDLVIDATPNIGAVHPVSILGDEYLQVLLLKGFTITCRSLRTERALIAIVCLMVREPNRLQLSSMPC